MKSKLLLTFLVALASLCCAQDATETKFNLPPGARLANKFVLFDLSEKLDKGYSTIVYSEDDLKFLKVLSEAQLQSLEGTDYYNYVMKIRTFVEYLPDKIKSIYTEAELFYIYAFDQKLKERILEFK